MEILASVAILAVLLSLVGAPAVATEVRGTQREHGFARRPNTIRLASPPLRPG